MNKNNILTNEETWNIIAESFDRTRKKPWPQVIDFINEISGSEIVADIGCGNGRNIIPFSNQFKKIFGIDISKKMLNIVKLKSDGKKLNNLYLLKADMINLPMKNDSFDAILFIASVHNIKGRDNRVQSLKEINRILKKDGKALISVWSRWQDKYRYKFFKKLVYRKEEFGDINIYWKQHNLNIPRFYHLYSKREFINDLIQSNLKIKKIDSIKLHSKISADNYFAIVQKGNYY